MKVVKIIDKTAKSNIKSPPTIPILKGTPAKAAWTVAFGIKAKIEKSCSFLLKDDTENTTPRLLKIRPIIINIKPKP